MATVSVQDGSVRIEFTTSEKLLSVHGSFTIPIENVAGASVEKPPGFWDALKFFGTQSPWPFKMAGTFLYHSEVVFFDYQREDTVLVIDLKPGASSYKHIFVHVDEPDTPAAAAGRILAAKAGTNVNAG
ncbi:MAG TPA: hypothetical protein VK669_07475 [Candidatus Limnocylindrales bacterium]|nr:hypothetical protein [Candidatus Limnocylindrales bacterium]